MALVQWLALASMLVDHLGAVGALGEWSRLIGRFAMPAFVVMIALNALVAPDPAALVRRLLLLLLLSQPVWWLTVGAWDRLCILVTLLAVVLLVWAWRARRLDLLALVAGVFLILSPWVEFGAWPLLLVPLVVVPGLPALLLALVWPLVQYPVPVLQVASLFVLLALVVLVRFPFNVPRAPRWLSRWFYPGHLAALALVTVLY